MRDEEQVDVLNEQYQIIGTELKVDAHKHGLLHKTVIGYLRYGQDWLLVEQAADRQDVGQLVAPVGGHVSAAELDIDALLRESKEEIGTANTEYTFIGSAQFQRQVIRRNENHLFIVYEITTNDVPVLGDEAVAMRRFTPSQLKSAMKNTPLLFGDALYFIFECFFPEYLPDNYQKRWT